MNPTDIVIAVAVAMFVYTGWSCFRHDWQRTRPVLGSDIGHDGAPMPPVPGRERPPSEKATPNPPRGPFPAPGPVVKHLRVHDCGEDQWGNRYGCTDVFDVATRTADTVPCDRHYFDTDAWNERLKQS